jgi:hypothetical protein
MTDEIGRRIKRGTILIYVTILLAAGQSFILHLGTTDYGHKTVSTYFIIEILILGLVIILGLKNRWTRIVLIGMIICETVLFFQDTPISPDDLLMTIIWVLRVYVIVGLFSRMMNHFYKTTN